MSERSPQPPERGTSSTSWVETEQSRETDPLTGRALK